ncbi:MAG: putative metal-dependent hydrolase [Bacteroidia bacterium]|nr:putative metal-dependent hydrolase [Bacteroidia bacterium]MCZ2277474.1 putative metal-dependent hydrolase [Bacteroidia bacterium]
MENLEFLRYPIGKFEKPDPILKSHVKSWRIEIEKLPRQLKATVSTLDKQQLNTPYREGGWTVRQVVHHLADSHINAFCRIKLALTEENPTIKPYNDDTWAKLADTTEPDIKFSLKILEGLHKRWVFLVKALEKKDYKRTYFHPGSGEYKSIGETIGFFAWHGRHHLAHIQKLKERNNWK